jgi:hypothetical protein
MSGSNGRGLEACESLGDEVAPGPYGEDGPWVTFSELRWPVPGAVREYLTFQALVSPPCPLAFALFTRYSVLAAFEYVHDFETDEEDHEELWQDFVGFADGDWTPRRAAAWVQKGLEDLAGEPLEEHWRRLYYLRVD